MGQDTEKQIKMVQPRYKDDYNRKIGSAAKKIETGQYVYPDGPPMTISVAERLATASYSKLPSAKIGPFHVI